MGDADNACKLQKNIDYCGQYGTCTTTGTGQIKCICERFRRGEQCLDFDYQSFFKKTYARVFGEDTWENMPSTRNWLKLRIHRFNCGRLVYFRSFLHSEFLCQFRYPSISFRIFIWTGVDATDRSELFCL